MEDVKETAEKIYNYMVSQLAEGVYISNENKREMIKQIEFKLYDLTEN